MNAELQQLAGIAAEADALAVQSSPAAAVEQAPTEPAGPDFGFEAKQATEMFAGLLTGYCPAAGEVWNEQAKAAFAGALSPVMQKYGWSFGTLPPELTLMVIGAPLMYRSAQLVAEKMRADKLARAVTKEPDAPPPVQGAPTEAAGNPGVHPQVELYRK